jgi:hypothetical protein
MKVPFGILLPHGYSSSDGRYPVLYLLHGGGKGRYSDFIEKLNISEYAKKYRQIIVMPSAPESWYVNSWKDPKLAWQDYLASSENSDPLNSRNSEPSGKGRKG